MRRVPASARSRSRILDDAELAAVWKTAEADDDVYGAFVRVALLCGQRRAKLAELRWEDLDDNVWRIRREPREKGVPTALALPPLAMTIITSQPHVAGSPYVFTGRGNGPLGGFSHRHALLMQHCGVTGFSVHDLRRCARSLMARAGVPSEHAERVLGHAISGVEGVYDRHSYHIEMADALRRLAALIEQIVRGEPGGNVLPWPAPAAAQP
jgi:integrase